MSVVGIDTLNRVLAPYIVTLQDYEILGSTPFRLNAMNGVYAPAKTGKTYFVLEQLNSLDPSIYNAVWLDGDRNTELKDKFPNIKHFPLQNTASAFEEILKQDIQYDNYIFVIDSFKDFSFGKDTDTNKGSQEVFEKLQELLNKGATLVIIFHATKLYGDGKTKGFKIKGNADTIESKMDFLYRLDRTKEVVTLTVDCARDTDMRTGDTLVYGNKDYVIQLIKDTVTSEPRISLRDLKKKPGLSSFVTIIDELEGTTYKITKADSTDKGGRPKQVVTLISEFCPKDKTTEDETHPPTG